MSEPTGTTAEHAATRLATLTASPEWAAKLMSGDAAARKEFDELSYVSMGLTAPAPPAEPTGPVAAAFELDLLLADKDKDASGRTFAERLNAGDAQARRHFDELTAQVAAITEGDWASAGFLPSNHLDVNRGMPLRDVVKAGADLMRSHEPSAVKDLFDGPAPNPAQRIVGKQMLAERMRDPAWMDSVSRAVRGAPGGDLKALAEWNSGAWALGG